MKVLNLYSGIGGNRKLWGDKHEITAVEINPKIAECYKKLFPNDNVIVDDAHEYLRKHFREFDFIWASPPCQTHSQLQLSQRIGSEKKFPDMKLYQEIIFLKHYFKKMGSRKCKTILYSAYQAYICYRQALFLGK